MEIPEEVWPAILKLSESAPSRRERIATACLIGLLGNPQWADIRRITVEEAILYADALIAELDKKED